MKVLNPNNLQTIAIADLLPSQGNLKDLTEKNYNKLKNTIIRRGFSVPVYVWEDKQGVKHLLDGHQRQRVLTTEGWNEPIPYLLIPAENLQEAMARLLEITSQYATITQEGIDEFIATYELLEVEVFEAVAFDKLPYIGQFDFVGVEHITQDGDFLSDKEDYENNSTNQIILIYNNEEYRSVIEKLKQLLEIPGNKNKTPSILIKELTDKI